MPHVLVFHEILHSLLQDLEDDGGNARFLCERGEECLDVEHDGAAEEEAAERLPVHPETQIGDGYRGVLGGAVLGAWVIWVHVKWLHVHKPPSAVLDRFVGGHF